MFALLSLIGLAAACPDVDQALLSAETDIASFYLRDGEVGLTEAMAGLACGTPATPTQLARLFQAQGMIWYLAEDDRADAAFVAARLADPEHWTSDYGDAAREVAEAVDAPQGEPGDLELKNVAAGEDVFVDGASATRPLRLVPGYHLVQVGAGETMRFARLVEVPAGGKVTVAAGTDATPTLQVARDYPFADIAPPLARDGQQYLDANGQSLSWSLQVQPLAASTDAGRAHLQLHRGAFTAQLLVGGAGLGAAYTTYLFGWDATTGRNLQPGVSWTLTTTAALGVVGAVVTEVLLVRRRRAHRRAIESAANRALRENHL